MYSLQISSLLRPKSLSVSPSSKSELESNIQQEPATICTPDDHRASTFIQPTPRIVTMYSLQISSPFHLKSLSVSPSRKSEINIQQEPSTITSTPDNHPTAATLHPYSSYFLSTAPSIHPKNHTPQKGPEKTWHRHRQQVTSVTFEPQLTLIASALRSPARHLSLSPPPRQHPRLVQHIQPLTTRRIFYPIPHACVTHSFRPFAFLIKLCFHVQIALSADRTTTFPQTF